MHKIRKFQWSGPIYPASYGNWGIDNWAKQTQPLMQGVTLPSFDFNKRTTTNTNGSPVKQNVPSVKDQLTASGISSITGWASDQLSDNIFGDSEVGRNVGNIFSQGVSSFGNTLANNVIKGEGLLQGAGINTGSAVAGATAGMAANYIGKGINSLGGDSMLSRGLGQGVATGLGTVGGGALQNIIQGKEAFGGIKDSISAINTFNKVRKTADVLKDSPEYLEALKSAKMGYANLAGLGGQVVGSALGAAFGPSKEYNGKYGGITRGMDTAYDLVKTGIGFVPGGQFWSGLMELNKGLSNVFGSTDGMTRQDAILGSAFMPAPVKWLNMAGAKTTQNFNNQSWQNTERTNSFMQNGFGDLGDRLTKAREEAGKTYGTFSQGARKRADQNLTFANQAWQRLLNMTDTNEMQNIRSQYMTSINNQRYAQMIQGGFNPLSRKQGGQILNNATNHKVGMRLLSGAALIDNKQMILCSAVD